MYSHNTHIWPLAFHICISLGLGLESPYIHPHPPSIWWIYHAINMGILFWFWERCPSIPIATTPPCHPFHLSLRAIVHIHLCISPLIHPFQVRLHQFMVTSVPCVVGPSVNTLRAQLNFPSKPNIFCNLFEISTTKIHSKTNIFHTLAPKFMK
jgi:hypothetical protein